MLQALQRFSAGIAVVCEFCVGCLTFINHNLMRQLINKLVKTNGNVLTWIQHSTAGNLNLGMNIRVESHVRV